MNIQNAMYIHYVKEFIVWDKSKERLQIILHIDSEMNHIRHFIKLKYQESL